MTIGQNKAIERRIFEEIWNQGKTDVIDEILAPDYVIHDPTGDYTGPEGYRQFFASLHDAFPDVHFTLDDQIAEGEWVATRWTSVGTHTSPLMGIPPTGKQTTAVGITISRIVDGKVVEEWNHWDLLGLLQQLGVVPAQGRTDFSRGEPSQITGAPGDPEANKAVIERYAEEVWCQHKPERLDEFASRDMLLHEAGPSSVLGSDFDAHKRAIALYVTAFPDLHSTVDHMVAEDGLVAVRWTGTGTHQGDLLGILPTGKQVVWKGITLYRFVDGKIVEQWWAWDALGLLQQLGVVPLPPAVLKGLHDAHRAALNAHDLDQWLAGWTDDAIWDYVPLPTPMDKEDQDILRRCIPGAAGFPRTCWQCPGFRQHPR
ncbi:MAG: ester cyclase [Anaerolineae bacterium]|nr:ester cyclase [Anaerolineae bacterium]